MTILEGDIKLLASRVMEDVPEGGGGPSGTVIPYGKSNGIFRDIPESARAGGQVSIRELVAAIQTTDVEPLTGVNIILSQPPTDPNVSITLAKCDIFARRTDIARAIANYLIEGTQWSGYLLEDHVLGMRSLQILHRPGTPAPDIGRTLVLSYRAGTSEERIEFVRVTRTETAERMFTYNVSGGFEDFRAAVTKVDLDAPLRTGFPGSPPSRSFGPADGKTVLRDTTVADAATYYGASPITVAAALGDSVLRVSSIYTQLVPSSRTETTALDQRPAAARTLVLSTSPRQVEVSVAAHTRRIRIGQSNRGFSYVAMLKPLPEPGTVVISYRALGNWYTLTDDGEGVLVGSGSGRVVYGTGSVDMTLQALPDDASSVIIQWGERVGYTDRSAQGALVRAPEYNWTLTRPGTERGSVVIKWPSGGVVRTATDDGTGKFTGDGAGTINYPTSGLSFRPKFMIDAGGQFAVTYDASALEEELIASPAIDGMGVASLTLAKTPLAGSIEVAWLTGQEVSTTSGATLSAAESGKKTEGVSVQTGYYPLGLYTSYLSSTGGGANIPPPEPAGQITPGTQYVLVPQFRHGKENTSATLTRSTTRDASNSRRIITLHSATDDGAGGFADDLGTVLYGAKTISIKLVSLDTTTSSYKSDHEDAKTFESTLTNVSQDSSAKGGEYGTTVVSAQQLGRVVVRYKVVPVAAARATESFDIPSIAIDLCPYTTDRIVPGSLRFAWMGHAYEDFEGTLYRGRTSNAPGIASGSVDYAAGLARLTDWAVGPSPEEVFLESLWTRRAAWNTASVFFRTQAAPLKPGGLVLTVLDLEGNALTATSGLDGSFTGTHMRGRMDFESGVAELQFGDYVDPATLTDAQRAEWWYSGADIGAVEPGKIWRPWPVDPSTLRYNSVAYFYLPLDADILGLDPVRLPPDGRVPIFRVGSFVVLGHTASLPAATLSNGQTLDMGRTRLSRILVVGANGSLIQTGYTANLDAGRLTVTDVSGWSQPVTVKHRIEEMARLSDVQIDGTVRLTKQLSHVFPVGSVLSSALMAGDLAARVSRVFDQQSWNKVTWRDTVEGDEAAGTYDERAYPITVSNDGAMPERFGIYFKTSTTFELYGEHVGLVGTGTTGVDFEPINPITGAPYMRVRYEGWGGGWVPGNVLFVHTEGAMAAFAAIRTVQPSEAAGTDYQFELLVRGNVDRP